MSEPCNTCKNKNGYLDLTNNSSHDNLPAPSGVLKIGGDPLVLKLSDYQGYASKTSEVASESSEVIDNEYEPVKRTSAKTCRKRVKAPSWLSSLVCAAKIKIGGIDEFGQAGTLCGSGYYYVKDGWVEIVEELPLKASDLYHQETILPSGQVGVGDPIPSPAISVVDENGKVWSQKPKAGQLSVFVGNGQTGLWSQEDLSSVPTCFKGALPQAEQIEIIGVASPVGTNLGKDEIRCATALKGEGIPFIEKVEDPEYADDCGTGYKYVATTKSREEILEWLGL